MMNFEEIMALTNALKAEVAMDIARENELYGEDFNDPSVPEEPSSEPAPSPAEPSSEPNPVPDSSVRMFLAETYKEFGFGILERRPAVRCADGFSVSVQASENNYCSPRENLPDGSYEEVELGYPSEADELIMEYAENPDGSPTDSVYGYVPVSVVEELIWKHGGMV